jgi:predicted RNA-binding Zn-ribbon protein involved in translation (DUF1610 family)
MKKKKEPAPKKCPDCVDGIATEDGQTFPCPTCRTEDCQRWAMERVTKNLIPHHLRPSWMR